MINIAICDDDVKDLNSVSNIIREICNEESICYKLQVFSSAMDMLEKIKNIDIGILDICMEKLNGIDLGRKLKQRFPDVKLIYTTSYEDYCMQAINDVHAFSFLCKPIDVNKLKSQFMDVTVQLEHLKDAEEKIFYDVTDCEGNEKAYLKLPLKDILYFEYMKSKRKVAIVLEDKTYEYSQVFEKLIEELKNDGYAVCCRGNLVNLRHITRIKGYIIHMDNGDTLPLAQKRAVEFKETLNTYIHHSL